MKHRLYPVPSSISERAERPRPMDTQRMLSMLLDNLEGMVYRCRDDAEWTMEFVSEGCYRLTGYQPDELLMNSRISYESITHPDDRDYVRQCVRQAIAQRVRFDVEYRIVRADGFTAWVWERGAGVFSADGQLESIEGFITDVTDRRVVAEALRETERRYRSIFEHATEGIFQTTRDGRYLHANPALARIYGYDSPEQVIAELRDIQRDLYVEPECRQQFVDLMQTQGKVVGFEAKIFRRDGRIIWILENARAVRNAEGVLLCYEGTVTDITDRKQYEEQLQYQATHDVLTGLPTRTLLVDRLEQALHFAERDERMVAVAFIDLDQFKLINDTLGHFAGDELLTEVAARLRRSVREADTIARLGGDEFVLVCAQVHGEEEIARAMQRVLETVSQPWLTGGAKFSVGCSIGISLYPRDGHNAETLLKHADSAMYKAKEAGRNNYQFFIPELNQRAAERLELESALRGALEREEFLLQYQPRVALKTGEIVGVEALIRWRLPGLGLVSPARFIPVAEETGLILPIGEWVLRTACAQAVTWQRNGWRPVKVSVNISPRQFRQEGLAEMVAGILSETGLEPKWLELELTESLVMHEPDRFTSMLHDLKAQGIEIAVDDFGTGYSSLNHLKRFPVDWLKVDQSFVRDLAKDRDDASIVQAIISLGHDLGLGVVAEGVETREQLEFLRHHGCDEVQGYYLGMPVAAEEFRGF
jgi:diguanylate cyclase (GGDEF)-like protein/PAS domain S-box-containing protein